MSINHIYNIYMSCKTEFPQICSLTNNMTFICHQSQNSHTRCGWDSTWPATAGWRMAKTLIVAVVPGRTLAADLLWVRGGTICTMFTKWKRNMIILENEASLRGEGCNVPPKTRTTGRLPSNNVTPCLLSCSCLVKTYCTRLLIILWPHPRVDNIWRAPLPTSCDVPCLPMLSSLSLLYLYLGLCPFSGLVGDLLLRGGRGLSTIRVFPEE